MKKYIILFLFFIISFNIASQTMYGLGTQWYDNGSWQFKAAFNVSWFSKNDFLKHIEQRGKPLELTFGADFNAGKNATTLKLRPLTSRLNLNFWDDNHDNLFPITLGTDIGYNLNLAKSSNLICSYGYNGIFISPNLNIDLCFLTIQGGYEYNFNHQYGNFYVSIILGPTLNFMKIID